MTELIVQAVCQDCGHVQDVEALDVIYNDAGEMESYMVGSNGFFCDECGSVELQHSWRKKRHLTLIKGGLE